MQTDERWMSKAVALARRGEGRTRPNPPVGAVIVRSGQQDGSGYHRRAGGPHAEIYALKQAGAQAAGATLYVTLEPCSTSGRTPPCTEAVLAAGIDRVVAGCPDPNPAHAGRGLRWLARRGVRVTTGVCEEEAETLIAPFSKWVRTGWPYVTLKLALTLDGRIADRSGCSKWITGPAARRQVQELRRRADAILVGRHTVERDDPSLLCRTRRRQHLLRVVVDSGGRTPVSAQVLCDPEAHRTVIATTACCPPARQQAMQRNGARIWRMAGKAGRVSLRALLRRLGREGRLHVLCEGGGQLAGALAREGRVDEYRFFVAARLLGGDALPAVGGRGWRLDQAPELCFTDCQRVGDDVLLRAVPRADVA